MEAAMVVGVTRTLVSTLSKFALEKLFTSVAKMYEQSKSVEGDIHFIKTELGMIVATLESQFLQGVHPSGVHEIALNTLRDLAYDIEDCLDRFLLCTSCEGYDVPFLSEFPTKIQDLKTRLMDARKQILDYANINHVQTTAAASTSRAPLPKVKPALGIDKPKQDLVELLLAEDIEGQQEQPRVISIVGFGGSGKTRLAREVYNSFNDEQTFPIRAWVEAWKYKNDYKGLMLALLKKLRQRQHEDMGDSDVEELQDEILQRLNAKRSLVVFDDIEEQQWDPSILPKNTRSRIIVTTTSQLVANFCSYGGGYIHNTTTLDKRHSGDLVKSLLTGHSRDDWEQVSSSIVKACDGHPLTLVSVANFLKRGNNLTESNEDICHRLGSQVEKASAFHELREVLMSNYGNLSDHLVKTCLLYMSVFPKGFEIRRSSLTRRWVAEGYAQSIDKVTDETVAHENFKKLLEQNIIERMGTWDNARVKTCRTHAIMREFMLHRSICDHFIGSFHAMPDDPSNFRHLFIQNCTNNNIITSGKKKLRARSLTIFGSGTGAISYIAESELLQVLDLKECNDFADNLLKDIMKDNLKRLKYLSLGRATTKLPKAIEKLHCLHTLELSKTKIVALPIEVIKLPHLVHLFGKIKLRKKKSSSALEKLRDIMLKKKSIAETSKLQTLAGFLIDGDSIFPELMVHMRGLKKVKIWCDSTVEGSTDWMYHLKDAIENIVMYEMNTGVGVRSLSLHLGNALENFLQPQFKPKGIVNSLKLQGKLNKLPNFVTSLQSITELCLSSTNLTGSDLSDPNLGKLPLRYLKLVEENLTGFTIKREAFRLLQCLCLVVRSPTPILPEIEENALPELVSLQLVCKHLHDLAGINIKNHTKLQEVALDSDVNMETINTWENEARSHPRRPKVLLFKRVSTARPTTAEGGPPDSMDIDY